MIKQVEFMGLNLTLAGIKEKMALEKALGNKSPIDIFFNTLGMLTVLEEVQNGGDIDFSRFTLPSLEVMLIIFHASAQKLNSGISMDKMTELIDQWFDQDGNSMLELLPVVIEVLQTGKYFPDFNEAVGDEQHSTEAQ